MNDVIPTGWQIMTYEQGAAVKDELYPLLAPMSIVAFDHGKLDGQYYGFTMQPSYGPECGEVFILTK